MLSENCCCVVCRPSRGRVICLLFSSPPRGICQRQFSIYPPKKCLSPGLVWGGMDANLKCTAPLKANRSEWSWFAVRKYMINFVECARPSRIIFLKNGYKRCFESSQIALAFSVCTNFSRNSLEVVRFAIQRWLTYVSLTWNHSVLTQKKQRHAYHRSAHTVRHSSRCSVFVTELFTSSSFRLTMAHMAWYLRAMNNALPFVWRHE